MKSTQPKVHTLMVLTPSQSHTALTSEHPHRPHCPQPRGAADLLCLLRFTSSGYFITGIIPPVARGTGFSHPDRGAGRSHPMPRIAAPVLFVGREHSTVRMDHTAYRFIRRRAASAAHFLLLATVTDAHVRVSTGTCVFISPEHTLRWSGTAGHKAMHV